MDLIDREAAITSLTFAEETGRMSCGELKGVIEVLNRLPSAQPEIIHCRDCQWWDKYGDYDNGYCMAAKHGHWSSHWEIEIRRKYKGDFYCADAERRTDE